MSSEDRERYRTDRLHAKSLENNPLNSPVDRDLVVYLPPGYFESKDRRYPVIYFLHGYSGNNHKLTVYPRLEDMKYLPVEQLPSQILEQMDLTRFPTYELFDKLITNGEWTPFIFVQPDGSLHIPHKDGAKDVTGAVYTKGSFYLNSAFTGNYEDYIVNDVITHVDAGYRTIPNKQYRALMGVSMGGYGTLSLSLHHPQKFSAAAAISPANVTFDLLDWKLVTPLYEQLFGREQAEQLGTSLRDDFLDTLDLIFSKQTPLLPSLKRDETGKLVSWDPQARESWQKYDLNNMIQEDPAALKEVSLWIDCEKDDEFGLTEEARKIHEKLIGLGIDHHCDIYSDPKAALSPHMFGCFYHVLPGIRFCLQQLT